MRFVLIAVLTMLACSSEDGVDVNEPDAQPDAQSHVDAGMLGPCFQEHLHEAIEKNEQRRPLYSSLSGGRSEALSDKLIESEKMSLIFARNIDEAAEPFQAVGIRIPCDEFISMSETPEFRDRFPFDPEPLSSYEVVDGSQFRQDLETAFEEGGFAAVSSLSTELLHSLEEPRAYHCMMRHTLESLRRIANFAPVHDARAKELGAQSPLWLSEDLVRLHVLPLDAVAKLDEQASPLQAEGLPILCQDVPPIPPGPGAEP